MHPAKYSLKGRVELVHLKAPVSYECVKGHSQAGEVLVSGARNYVGRDVLVLFDPIQDPEKSLPIGNFLTSKPPEYFSPLSPEEHVLCYGEDICVEKEKKPLHLES